MESEDEGVFWWGSGGRLGSVGGVGGMGAGRDGGDEVSPVVLFGSSGGLLLLLSRFSRVRLCATPETAAHQAPPTLGFSRQEHWSGLPFPSPMHESEK